MGLRGINPPSEMPGELPLLGLYDDVEDNPFRSQRVPRR